jgi:hypothetical protein
MQRNRVYDNWFEDESAVLYRLGSITIEEIEAVIGSKNKKHTQGRSAISSWNAFKTLCA